jgi:hypothetical protein
MHETEAYSNQLLASSASSMKPVELVVVTYATSDIVEYAAFSMATAALCAESHGYPMRIYDQTIGDEEIDNKDPRWNKVPAVLHAITKWANPSTAQAALWVDADLTVLAVSQRPPFLHLCRTSG